MQPPLDLKQILPFPLEPAPTLGLFSNYNTSQAEAHYKGNRHARRVKGIEAAKTRGREPGVREPGDPAPPGSTPQNGDGVAPRPVSMENGLGPAPGSPEKQPGSPSPPSIPETGQGTTKVEGGTPAPASLPGGSKEEEEKAKRLLYCALCKVAVNSLSQLEAHNKGTKHKTILEARSGLGPIKAYPRLGPPTPGEPEAPAQDRTFHCEICNVKVNSEVQLKQHISSRRHRDGVAGKPNPLLSRHKKPRGSGELAGTLTFSKELPKSLAGGLLPSPLAVAAVMAAAAGSPLSLRPAPAAPLLQGPPITHPLLHPAPGPIRTAHGPILFPPYSPDPNPPPLNPPPPPPAGTQASRLQACPYSRHSLNDLSPSPPPRGTGFQERGGVAGEGGFRRGGTPQISGNPAPCPSLSPRKGGAVSPPSPLGDTPPPKSHVHSALPPPNLAQNGVHKPWSESGGQKWIFLAISGLWDSGPLSPN
nr:zinc finger protein 385A isoform X4 [Neomonachus schauinslandi]